MTEQLPSVPEESTTSFTAPSPRSSSYRESIQSVAWPQWQLRSALSSQSGQSGSSYSSISGASSSYMSNISGCSSGAAELTKIAHRMVSDGYTQRVLQGFKCSWEKDRPLETWFTELDVYWVLQNPILHYDTSASDLHGLAERWIRALTITIISIKELVAAVQETLVVARFSKASISAMLVFIHVIRDICPFNTEKLPAMVQVYICLSNASHDLLTMQVISPDAQRIFNEIGALLERKVDMFIGSMSDTVTHVERLLMMSDNQQWPMLLWRSEPPHWFSIKDERNVERPDYYSWASEITVGGGVHRNTQLMVDYILLMRKAQYLAGGSAPSQNIEKLRGLIQDMPNYLKNLLLTKSKLCSDPSLRYLFLLNNSYFILQAFEPSVSLSLVIGYGHLKFTSECKKYMDSYLDVSWGHVMSCIPKSNFPRPLRRWINTSALAKFQSAFHQTYHTQKFWEVPDPQLRSLLRETITKKVIPGYRDYLKENPELEKHASSGSNSPKVMEEMLGEIFEG